MVRKIFWKLSLLLAASLGSLKLACGQNSTMIDGRVLDEKGRPLQGARIVPFPLEAAVSGGMPYTVTDGNGEYRLSSPAYGKTRITVIKEDAGYPNTSVAVFAPEHDTLPIVMLTEGVHLHDIDIHLPSPDGTVEGRITNAKTGEPIAAARITINAADNPDILYATGLRGGTYFYPLPEKKLQITIEASGFKPAHLVDPATGKAYVELRRIDHRKIDVALEPLP